MNNIRKIIEERLDNARNDYHNYPVLSTNDITLGQIEAYQDCLNLIPAPRTEQDILNDFEALGWNVDDGYVNFTLKKIKIENDYFGEQTWYCYISIDKENKTYKAIRNGNFMTNGYDLSMQEHNLLSELFEVIF